MNIEVILSKNHKYLQTTDYEKNLMHRQEYLLFRTSNELTNNIYNLFNIVIKI